MHISIYQPARDNISRAVFKLHSCVFQETSVSPTLSRDNVFTFFPLKVFKNALATINSNHSQLYFLINFLVAHKIITCKISLAHTPAFSFFFKQAMNR